MRAARAGSGTRWSFGEKEIDIPTKFKLDSHQLLSLDLTDIPGFGRRMLELAADMPEQSLRLAGATAVAGGVLLVWLIRG